MRKSVSLATSMALAVLLASGAAWAAAGDLDKTFGGGDGKVVNKQHETYWGNVEVLPNGKIVTFNGYLVRYNADGSLDRSFGGGDGEVFATDLAVTPHPSYTLWRDLLLQPDGKLVVAGHGDTTDADYPEEVILRRFNPDGSVDETFGGGDGTTVASFGDRTRASASELALQGDKIVVVGGREPFAPDAFVMRFNPDGSADETFGGGDGRVFIDFFGSRNSASAVAVLGDGKLLVAGPKEVEGAPTFSGHYAYNFTLARLHPDGALDPSFGGGDGRVVTDLGGDDVPNALVVRQGERPVVVGGTSKRNETSAFALAAYTSGGSPDEDFGGGDGKVLDTFAGPCFGAFAADAVEQASGKIVAVGSSCSDNFALARYRPASGALDKTFGGDGTVETRFFDYRESAAMAADIGPGGNLVAGGYIIRYDRKEEDEVYNEALARYRLE